MIGSIVNHPLFGRGQVLELRNAAREAAVRFDNGIRTIVQTNMLSILETAAKTATASVPRQVSMPHTDTAPTPEQAGKMEARQSDHGPPSRLPRSASISAHFISPLVVAVAQAVQPVTHLRLKLKAV